MSSKIKVDTIENVAGSGNVSLGSGHNLVVPGNITGQGTAAITSNATVGGTLGVTGATTLSGNLEVVSGTASINNTSNGTLASFKKSGTTIGHIGVHDNDGFFFTRGATQQGIVLKNSSLMPCNTDGSNSDNDQDLGISSVRWKDLYLSGGLKIGGTGAANTLDDYEEGNWTPVLEGSGGGTGVAYSRRQGRYTKVGDKVFVNFHIVLSSEGTITSTAKISGLPFSGNSEPLYQVCHIMSGNMSLDKDQTLTGMQYAANAFIYLMIQESDLALSQVTGNGSFKNNSEMVGMCTYYTNS